MNSFGRASARPVVPWCEDSRNMKTFCSCASRKSGLVRAGISGCCRRLPQVCRTPGLESRARRNPRSRNRMLQQTQEREPMANTEEKPALKITLEDLAKVTVPQEAIRISGGAVVGAARQYGNISTSATEAVAVDEGKSSIFLQGWLYLRASGALSGQQAR